MTTFAVPQYAYSTGVFFDPSSPFEIPFQPDDSWSQQMGHNDNETKSIGAHSTISSTVPSLSNAHSMHSVSSSVFNSPELCPPLNHPGIWSQSGLDAVNSLLSLNTNFEADPATFSSMDGTFMPEKAPGFVDPSVLQPPLLTPVSTTPVSVINTSRQRSFSPAASFTSFQSTNPPILRSNTQSPYPRTPFTQSPVWHSKPSLVPRRESVASASSHIMNEEVETTTKGQTRCPYRDCQKVFKDLKAHMLTHQNERPEKCPIVSCEFHKKGFARKYDRNRHLVTTHYKSTIICGFCPGSGSAAEKSFNRTDVFKRHLVAVHGVEANSANSKKRTSSAVEGKSQVAGPGITGKCSTCGSCFNTAQAIFEHLDDCVLRVVTKTDPTEGTNEQHLLSIEDDKDFQATMDRNTIHEYQSMSSPTSEDEWLDDITTGNSSGRSGKGAIQHLRKATNGTTQHTTMDGHISKTPLPKGRPGMTFSKGGKPIPVGKGRKKRKGEYPQSWGCAQEKMMMKKRVVCVFDGQRRLCKDDMMLGTDQEVRLPIGNDGAYITDLDVETLRRAEGFHGATEEERGPWIYNNYRVWDPETQVIY